MALLVPDVSLLGFTILKKKFMKEKDTFFIWDKYCPLTVCLHLMEPNCEVVVKERQDQESGG